MAILSRRDIGPFVLICVSLLLARELFPYADIHDPRILEAGYVIEEVADNLGGPTCLHWADENWLLVCDRDSGSIKGVWQNSAGSFSTHVLLSGLDNPHGVLTWQDPDNGTWRLIVSEEGKLSAWDIATPDAMMWRLGLPQVLVDGVPTGNHQTNAVMDGKNGTLIWHAGSTCNVCQQEDPRNAALLWVNPWTGEHGVAASGVRNSFDGTWVEGMGYVFTDNGRDWDGDHPDEEINLFSAGSNYGWPDDEPETPIPAGTLGPVAVWAPHSSINGIDFRPHNSSLPGGDFCVYATVYGSWNSLLPVGHEIIRIDFTADENSPQGWSSEVSRFAVDLGTPLPLRFSPDGDLYFATFAQGGTLYRIVESV
ncbi:MAG: hypothetical protein HOE92_07205 [Euryarchaeota archaeon]|jgi:glucose/arabinose dehydrogenase|nr:hypothetical protein [Euryarchaeota archaeon]MBT6644260.1 hypothetical protein [Euryarchaeota archaeon]